MCVLCPCLPGLPRTAARAATLIGRQFDVPWRVWGGVWASSTQSSVGTVASYHRGCFTLTFPRSAAIEPILLTWGHVLGEDKYAEGEGVDGVYLRERAVRYVEPAASSGSGLPVGARQYVDRTPQKARLRPLPAPFRVLAFGDTGRDSVYVGHCPADHAPPRLDDQAGRLDDQADLEIPGHDVAVFRDILRATPSRAGRRPRSNTRSTSLSSLCSVDTVARSAFARGQAVSCVCAPRTVL